MRVLLVSANTEKVNMPTMPVGLAMVSAATRRAGHEVRFLDLMFEEDPAAVVRRAVTELQPEVIGISVRNIDDQELQGPRFLLEQVRPVVRQCRELGEATIVLGGAGYSIFPDEALAYLGADLGLRGDGEAAFLALLERLEAGTDPAGLPGLHLRGRGGTAAGLPEELDVLPLPEDELWRGVDPARQDLWMPLQSRRGCPNDCAYCSTALIQGRTIRCRSPRQVVDAIEPMVRAGFRRYYFVDNSFNIPLAHGLELCREISSRDLSIEWRAILYPHRVGEELVREMARAGCVEVALGFESGADPVLRGLNKRFTVEEVRSVAACLRKHGIRRMGFLMLGGPGETRETVEQSLAFAASLDLDCLRVTVGIRLYPDTPLARRAVDEGLIDGDDPLLHPRFYLAPGLERGGWIFERVKPGVRR